LVFKQYEEARRKPGFFFAPPKTDRMHGSASHGAAGIFTRLGIRS